MADALDFYHWSEWITHMTAHHDSRVMQPTPMVQRALAALPKHPAAPWSVAQFASGTGRDTRALLADPRIGTLTAFDGAPAAQRIIADIGFAMLGGDTSRLIGVEAPFESLDLAAMPKVGLLYASAGFSYVTEDKFESFTRGALDMVQRGGIASVSFMARSERGYGEFPTTGIDAETLRDWFVDAGFSGTIQGFGAYAKPLTEGADPVMFEVLARRQRTARPTDAASITLI